MRLPRRSAEFWFSFAAGMFIVCLAAAAYAAHRYANAEAVYTARLGHVTFTPHSDALKALDGYARTADRWLRAQIITASLTGLAAINVLLQLVRRRNARASADRANAP